MVVRHEELMEYGDAIYEMVYWDHPGFGSCVHRSKEPLVREEANPVPLRVGTVLYNSGAIGIVIARRKTLDGTDIYGNSVAVELVYSYLMEKYKMPLREMKYAVWAVQGSEILKGDMAEEAKKDPKLFVTAFREAEAKAEEEYRRLHPLPPPPPLLTPTRPAGRTAVKRTPVVMVAKPSDPVPKTPVQKTPVVKAPTRTPVKIEKIDPIEEMRRKLSKI